MVWTGALALVTALFSAPDPGWRWPLRPPPEILRPFDPPAHPWEAGHRGTDLAARAGQPVYAAGPGRVGFAHDLAGRGVVTVIHGRLRTTYLPVRPSVRAGQQVAAGARIGVVEDVLGHCGQSTCLHWGLRQGVAYFDPLTLLGRGPVRLMPWWHDTPSEVEPPGLPDVADHDEMFSPTDPADGSLPPAPTGPPHGGRSTEPFTGEAPNGFPGALDPAWQADPSRSATPAGPSTHEAPDDLPRTVDPAGGPTPAPSGGGPPSDPAGPAQRSSPGQGPTLAIASSDAPASRHALLAAALAALTIAVFRAQRSSAGGRRRTTAPSYPQNVIPLPRKVTIRQVRRRR